MDKDLIDELCEVIRDSVFELSQDEIDTLVKTILILQKLNICNQKSIDK